MSLQKMKMILNQLVIFNNKNNQIKIDKKINKKQLKFLKMYIKLKLG